MNTRRIAAALIAVTLAAACGGDDDDPGGGTSPDPYDAYLDNAPAGEPTLTRDDAQARAMLGCGQDWAPGTVDAVLADAYSDLCD